jgi:hypothetical protein
MKSFCLAPLLLALTSWTASSELLQNPYFFEIKKSGPSLYLFGTNHIGIHINEVPEYLLSALKRQRIYMTETLKDSGSESDDSEPGDSPIKPYSQSVIKQLEERGFNAKWIELIKKCDCCLHETWFSSGRSSHKRTDSVGGSLRDLDQFRSKTSRTVVP